jgi:hypothetical protein
VDYLPHKKKPGVPLSETLKSFKRIKQVTSNPNDPDSGWDWRSWIRGYCVKESKDVETAFCRTGMSGARGVACRNCTTAPQGGYVRVAVPAWITRICDVKAWLIGAKLTLNHLVLAYLMGWDEEHEKFQASHLC